MSPLIFGVDETLVSRSQVVKASGFRGDVAGRKTVPLGPCGGAGRTTNIRTTTG